MTLAALTTSLLTAMVAYYMVSCDFHSLFSIKTPAFQTKIGHSIRVPFWNRGPEKIQPISMTELADSCRV
jgi:hypothetical protein